jgi:plasmid stabilization system protein ParE
MAKAIIWTQEALDDIDGIADYISRDSSYHAQRVVEALLDLGDSLIGNAHAGRVVPELNNPQVRERFLYSYRLLYEIGEDRIEILAVVHGRRLLESIGERFE